MENKKLLTFLVFSLVLTLTIITAQEVRTRISQEDLDLRVFNESTLDLKENRNVRDERVYECLGETCEVTITYNITQEDFSLNESDEIAYIDVISTEKIRVPKDLINNTELMDSHIAEQIEFMKLRQIAKMEKLKTREIEIITKA